MYITLLEVLAIITLVIRVAELGFKLGIYISNHRKNNCPPVQWLTVISYKP